MTLSPQFASLLVLLGLLIGIVSGVVGLGGGIMVIPALILFCGFTQQKANGTSLAMLLPPIGIFAVMTYHKAGNIDWPVAMLVACGFAVGAYFGGLLVNTGRIPETPLRIIFSMLLLYVAGRMLFRAEGRAWAALETLLLMAGFVGSYVVLRLFARKWAKAPYWPAVYQDRQRLPVVQDYEI